MKTHSGSEQGRLIPSPGFADQERSPVARGPVADNVRYLRSARVVKCEILDAAGDGAVEGGAGYGAGFDRCYCERV